MKSSELGGKVALVTGGANGIGEAVARRLAGRGAHVVIADVDDVSGHALAEALDGLYVHCDVADLADNEAAVAAAVERYALCPSITETALIAPLRSLIEGRDFPILDVDDVVDAFFQILDSDATGECWFVVAGRPSEPFRFRHAPGPGGSGGSGGSGG